MRGVNKTLLVFGVCALGLTGMLVAHRASAVSGGLTVTPATITLSLAPGSKEASSVFTITNQYETPIRLHFAFEQPLDDSRSQSDPAKLLTISNNDVTLGAREGIRQTVMLRDSNSLQPGSQRADLVISAEQTLGTNIAVQPGIRMPVILIKKDGATQAMSLRKLAAPRISFGLPGTIAVTIRNTGNTIVIPRGVITIAGPDGATYRSAALNTASSAISPGEDVKLTTNLQTVQAARWPGVYQILVSYSLGNGGTAQTAAAPFLYIAWWHIVLLLGIIAAAIYGWKWYNRRLKQRKKPPARRKP